MQPPLVQHIRRLRRERVHLRSDYFLSLIIHFYLKCSWFFLFIFVFLFIFMFLRLSLFEKYSHLHVFVCLLWLFMKKGRRSKVCVFVFWIMFREVCRHTCFAKKMPKGEIIKAISNCLCLFKAKINWHLICKILK